MSKETFTSFLKTKIVRDFNKFSIVWIVFWSIVCIVLYLVLVFAKSSKWYDAQSMIGLLLICVSAFSTVLRLGFFNSYSKTYKNWKISSENKMRRENQLPEIEKVDDNILKAERQKKSLIPILLGFVVGLILIIIALPFFNS